MTSRSPWQVTLCYLVVCGLTACGGFGQPKTEGHAKLWVTRDRGARVLLVREVPAGLTVLQALDREADVKTRYGGRYVQAINGVAGSITARRDWFYFVNGIEADQSAAEYKLRPGDVEWWDYRSWGKQMRVPVVVGAFPEPFLHGYGGKRRPAAVLYRRGQASAARALAKLIHATWVRPADPISVKPPGNANVLFISGKTRRFVARSLGGTRVMFELGSDAPRLAQNPSMYRFRYAVP